MTVYDPALHQTAATVGQTPSRVPSINKIVLDLAAAGFIEVIKQDGTPGAPDLGKVWLKKGATDDAAGTVKIHDGTTWQTATKALLLSHLGGVASLAPANTMLANNTGSPASASYLTTAQIRTMLGVNVFTSGATFPTTPSVGDEHINTASTQVSGIPAGGIGKWDGTKWRLQGVGTYTYTQSGAQSVNLTNLGAAGENVTGAFTGAANGSFTLNPSISSGTITPEAGFYQIGGNSTLNYTLSATGDTIVPVLALDVGGTNAVITATDGVWAAATANIQCSAVLATYYFQFNGSQTLKLRWSVGSAVGFLTSATINSSRITLTRLA